MAGTLVQSKAELLEALLAVGVNLSAVGDRRAKLEMILHHARRLAHAQAGSLYVVRDGRLRFVAAQNDLLAIPEITCKLLDKESPVSADSLAGYVAATGGRVNIPDAYAVGGDAGFRHNRSFDRATGYRTRSILAMALKIPEGKCIGVLELINCVDSDGAVVKFPCAESSGLASLASMAAVTIHNTLLQEDLKRAQLETIIRLSVAAEFRDNDTAAHIRRMSHTSSLIARSLGLGESFAELLLQASPMHDIGKIGIPDSVLTKPGPLSPQERGIMQTHTQIGAEILKDSKNELIRTGYEVALCHHERWDGRGYPRGLAGYEIPLSARIAALADVFDALVTRRCYKQAYTLEKACGIVRAESGGQFDPAVAKAFFDVLDDIIAPYKLPARHHKSELSRK